MMARSLKALIRQVLVCVLVGLGVGVTSAASATELTAVPGLDLSRYMGTWYQVALYPNRFQRQCVSDTTATYRLLPSGEVEVRNRCKTRQGDMDEALGLAQTLGAVESGRLTPARLRVSFVPQWLRWSGVGWGAYWVIQLAPDYRYAVISEPSREYLWILARTPSLAADDDARIRDTLKQQGFDLARLQAHPHGPRTQSNDTP
jgi:apolipoprotein D and lipocalin family protein